MLERLQKIIARAGIASRRHAEELILSGQVRVNGVVITELGAKADPERDRVEAAGRVAERPAEPGYFLLHKPIHVVSTMSDPEGRATLRHVLRGLAGGVFPVGRLDYAASGLMLLTSDGELADRIFRNSARMPQVYWLKVAGRLTDDEMQQIGQRARARLRRLRAPGAAASHPANPWYEVELNDARRDLLRRALFAIDHPVEKMKRVKLGPLELGDLAEGHYRSLEPREVAQLRRMVEQASGQPKGAGPAAEQKKASASAAAQTKRTTPAWRPKSRAPEWQTKSAAGAGKMKTGAPAWQNKSGVSAGQTRSASTPWQAKSAAGAGQRKTGASAWHPKGSARKEHPRGTRRPHGHGREGHGGRDRHHGHDARNGHGKGPRPTAQ
jgi:23S rRNA pseudouridine2605 synthase